MLKTMPFMARNAPPPIRHQSDSGASSMQEQDKVSEGIGRLMAGATSSNIRYFTGAVATGVEAVNSAKLAARHSVLPATSLRTAVTKPMGTGSAALPQDPRI